MQAHENGSAHTSPPPRMSCPSASLLGKNHNNLIIPEMKLAKTMQEQSRRLYGMWIYIHS